jgi:23S rRNA (pseudouridine1915-N3)-methyltransferase
LRLIAVGRLRSGPEAELFSRYASRLRPALTVTEIPEATGAPAEIKRRDSTAILAALPPEAFAVPLDLGGKTATSEAFAALLASWQEAGRKPAFLIGGAEGLGASVLARADYVLSLGTLTWPHMLVRVMLAEQLYRAQAIAAGHPYHRAGRP